MLNPTLQGIKFDPSGTYVRRRAPELAGVPDAYLHKPLKMPADMQGQVGCVIGRDYPQPVVDHARARQAALMAYRQPHDDGL